MRCCCALAKTLTSSNPIESMISIARTTNRNVTRWRDGQMILRWTAAGMLNAQRSFRRVKGHSRCPNSSPHYADTPWRWTASLPPLYGPGQSRCQSPFPGSGFLRRLAVGGRFPMNRRDRRADADRDLGLALARAVASHHRGHTNLTAHNGSGRTATPELPTS